MRRLLKRTSNGSAENTPLLAWVLADKTETKEDKLQCLIIMVIQINL
jgi:hypothetical protein